MTKKNYKDTLNLPKTTLPINANLPVNEQKKYQEWEANKVYDRLKRNGENPFILHDGPPYANGDIHIGHAMNKILKDFVVKFHYFSGRAVEFVPGWDCHGLPIEKKVKENYKEKPETPQQKVEFRKHCREYAATQIDKQKAQFKTLGVVADWDNPYSTMNPQFEMTILDSLYKLAEKDLLIEREKPVYWSWAEQTALAEAEIEYKERTDTSVYVVFPFTNKPGGLLVWTTTPWTLPANSGVAINPHEMYALLEDDNVYVAEKLAHKFGKVKSLISAQELAEKSIWTPLKLRVVPIVCDEFVTMDMGTGIVHLAPGHGDIDYQVGLKNNLSTYTPVDEKGLYTDQADELTSMSLAGKHVLKSCQDIVNSLKAYGTLYKEEPVVHSYPHCWRSGTPIIYRATKQWFLNLDKLRELAKEKLKKVSFVPEHSYNKLLSMVEGRPDWCLSRQRLWGVPIAFFRQDGVTVLEKGIFETTKEMLKNDIDNWEKCSSSCRDILDVWFDSGLTWNILNGRKADIYLEGNDQHRGWFQSSLWLSVALTGEAPYKQVLTHGMVVDSSGEKMAKSKGNGISPQEIVKKHGADVLRYWVATSDYEKEMRISPEIVQRAAEGYKKLRNTFRFLLANLGDEEPLNHHLLPVDAWILNKSKQVFDAVYEDFSKYNYCGGMHKLTEYVNTDLSGIYMAAIKDRLYCGNKESRNGAQYVMFKILKTMLGLVAPLFTYMADEVFANAPDWFKGESKDIFDIVYESLEGFRFVSCGEKDMEKWEECILKQVEIWDEAYWKAALESFHKEFSRLKDTGIVKDTLEVSIIGPNGFGGAYDWFVVSMSFYGDGYKGIGHPDRIGTFFVNEDEYLVVLNKEAKCDRCWKREHNPCWRCAKVLTALTGQQVNRGENEEG